MKCHVFLSYTWLIICLCLSSHAPLDQGQDLTQVNEESDVFFSESLCHTGYEGLVKTYDIEDGGRTVGNSIWLKRSGMKRIKAKYFAYKQNGQSVHERYDNWRSGKDVLLMTSGGYSTGWYLNDIPVGITVDNGKIVNRKLESNMDGLLIVEATGGIRVHNIKNANLRLRSLGNYPMDLTNVTHRYQFLNWAQTEYATVFQTHLLIHNNELKVSNNGSNRTARREFLILATDSAGNFYHIIFYIKNASYTLYESSSAVLQYFRSKQMNIFAALNLETGGANILNTGDIYDCSGNHITGTHNNNRYDLPNMLVYYYE